MEGKKLIDTKNGLPFPKHILGAMAKKYNPKLNDLQLVVSLCCLMSGSLKFGRYSKGFICYSLNTQKKKKNNNNNNNKMARADNS